MEIQEYPLKPIPRIVPVSNSEDLIYLTVKIGNGQVGSNNVSLDGTQIAKGDLTEPILLGDTKTLMDKEIEIYTNVLDVNLFTNKCVITTTFLNQENTTLFTKIDQGDAPPDGMASFIGKYVIRLLTVFIVLFLSIPSSFAQTNSESIELSDLETPSSPGFILLDKAPASIQKPTTPQGLGLGLLGIQQNGGFMEFTPYWLVTHPNLSARDMREKNFLGLLTHSAVSIAALKTDTSNHLAGGIRTRLFQIFKTDSLNKIEGLIINELSNGRDINKAKVKELQRIYVELIEQPIFSIDLAAAIGGGIKSNSLKDLSFNRWAAWLTFNVRPKGQDFFFTILTRYIYNDNFESYSSESNLFDFGTSLNYDISKISISLEYIQRMNFRQNVLNDYRIAAIGNYEVLDGIFITTSIGKNFSDINNIIALAGIDFGFSKKKIKF